LGDEIQALRLLERAAHEKHVQHESARDQDRRGEQHSHLDAERAPEAICVRIADSSSDVF
jgi:hypothetical protein